MPDVRRPEVLYHTEHSLRLVDSALSSLARRDGLEPAHGDPLRPGSLEALADTLIAASRQIASLRQQLQASRGILERASVERLGQMEARLRQVSSATEIATNGMLDGLERAIALVDSLGDATPAAPYADHAAVRTAVRDTLYEVMTHLQFQDITSQQMGYASAVITETEQRLAKLSETLASFAPEFAAAADGPTAETMAGHCDPNATVESKFEQQAFADQAFARA